MDWLGNARFITGDFGEDNQSPIEVFVLLTAALCTLVHLVVHVIVNRCKSM